MLIFQTTDLSCRLRGRTMTTEVQKPNPTIICSWAHRGVRLQDLTHAQHLLSRDIEFDLQMTSSSTWTKQSSWRRRHKVPPKSTGNFIILHVIRDIPKVKVKLKVTLARPWRQRVSVEEQLCRTELCVYLRYFFPWITTVLVPLM